MTTSNSYSQGSEKIPVSKSTLKNIYRHVVRCDSLQVSYDLLNKEIDRFIKANDKLTNSLLREQTKSELLQTDLENTRNKLFKLEKKKTNRLTWGLGGLTAGILLMIIFN